MMRAIGKVRVIDFFFVSKKSMMEAGLPLVLAKFDVMTKKTTSSYAYITPA